MRLVKFAAWICLWVVALGCVLWAFGAVYFDFPITTVRIGAASLFGLSLLGALIFVPGKVWKLTICFGGFFLVLCWWLTLKPTNDRAWQPDVAETAWAQINGDEVTFHNVRNCDYRTDTDFTTHWETRSIRLSQITGMDVYIMYWGSPWMAHPIVSFRFADALPLCFSIETRKAIGQEYSALRGLYRQYTLIYIVADERDSIRVRSKYRHGEDVYLYRTLASPQQARARFLEYMNATNTLRNHPRWYNALTGNCTTNIRTQRSVDQRASWDWRMLVNGKSDELLYERHLIATGGLPFSELKRRSQINKRASDADQDPDFSRLIREGLPKGK
jgi:Domain of unknown function (DUF4105)